MPRQRWPGQEPGHPRASRPAQDRPPAMHRTGLPSRQRSGSPRTQARRRGTIPTAPSTGPSSSTRIVEQPREGRRSRKLSRPRPASSLKKRRAKPAPRRSDRAGPGRGREWPPRLRTARAISSGWPDGLPVERTRSSCMRPARSIATSRREVTRRHGLVPPERRKRMGSIGGSCWRCFQLADHQVDDRQVAHRQRIATLGFGQASGRAGAAAK